MVKVVKGMNILDFIQTIRESFVGAEQVYTRGSCYRFYLILKQVWPQAEAYYDHNHVVTEIDGRCYDITGEVGRGDKLRMSDHFPPGYKTGTHTIYECQYDIFNHPEPIILPMPKILNKPFPDFDDLGTDA